MFGNSTRSSRRTHPSITTAATASAGSATIITAVAMVVVTELRASNHPLRRLAHRRKELQERMLPTTVRNMLNTMELIRTQHMVVTRTTSPTTSITSKLHNNSSSSNNSLRALLLHLPQHLRPPLPHHRGQDLPHRPLPVAATALYVFLV